VLCGFALAARSTVPVRSVNSTLVTMVRSGSPICWRSRCSRRLVPDPVDYLWGCASVLIAVLGIGVRTTLIQVHQIERREALRRKHRRCKPLPGLMR